MISRAHTDQKVRTAYLVDALVSGAPLDGKLREPNTAGDIELSADLKARRISAAVSVSPSCAVGPDQFGGAGCSLPRSRNPR